jgi:S1-C subfamily serine protease
VSAALDGIRVRLRGPEGDVGDDVPLPATLPGTESGGMYVVEVLRGSPEALATLELFLSRAAGAPPDRPIRPPLLVPGTPLSVFLGGHGSDSADFLLNVPASSPGLVISATATSDGEGSHPDPDIYVQRGRPIDSPLDDADYLGIARGDSETVRLGGAGGLPADAYYVRVQLVDGEQAGDVTVLATALEAVAPIAPEPIDLAVDTWTPGSIHAETAAVQWYAVRVPPGAESINVQVVDATSDVDLFLVDPQTGAIVGRSLEFQIDECLACRPWGGRRPSWLVGIASQSRSEDDVDFRVAVSVDRAPKLPADLRLPPFVRTSPQNDVERAASAVAEVSVSDGSGSAVCIDPRGYLLTCHHVVVDDSTHELTKGLVLIAFPDDLRKAPRQSFRARVIESDEALDLALLRIESDVYGRPVPADLGLPSIPLGDADALHLGDPLLVVGYPGDGSERSRPPVTVSRGVVAGLEAFRDELQWIKTDAWIATGHSGGAVLDRDGRVVGIAAATLGSHDAMGLVRPVGLLPHAWLERAKIAVPGRK